jgi:quinol monooxygenase YgiN
MVNCHSTARRFRPTLLPLATIFPGSEAGDCSSSPQAYHPLPLAMLIVHVHIHVKPDCLEAFRAATLANARASVQEPGIARFDFVQQVDDPTRFVLVEVYRHAAAPAAHKETAHYAAWRDAVAPLMATPRTSVKFSNVFPDDAGW